MRAGQGGRQGMLLAWALTRNLPSGVARPGRQPQDQCAYIADCKLDTIVALNYEEHTWPRHADA